MEKGKGRLWFHTASVGEFNTAKPLLRRLYEQYHITLTYFSFRARKYLEGQKDKTYFHQLRRLPPDLPFFIRRFERAVDPKAILIIERELWPFLILSTKAPKVWLNVYSKKNLMEKLLCKKFSLIITREEKDAENFRGMGCDSVVCCGNLKFVLEEPPPLELSLEGSRLFVAGSTHPGEEAVIKRVYERLLKDFPDIKLLVAPRHISRSVEVARLFEGFKVSLRTKEEKGWEVLVLDTLGELFSLYRHASLAFVGGTLVPVGGHNLLEPAYFGKPVLYGPHTHKVQDLRRFLEDKGIGFCVRDEEELYRKSLNLLERGGGDEVVLRTYSERTLECYLTHIDLFLKKVL